MKPKISVKLDFEKTWQRLQTESVSFTSNMIKFVKFHSSTVSVLNSSNSFTDYIIVLGNLHKLFCFSFSEETKILFIADNFLKHFWQ